MVLTGIVKSLKIKIVKKMKTKILSLILLFVVITGISNLTYAASVNNADYVVLNDIKTIIFALLRMKKRRLMGRKRQLS